MTRIVIIGGGPAGYEAALVAAQLGAQVTVIERDGIGGASVLTDCVPSKTLIAAAGTMTSVRDSAVLGLQGAELATVSLDLASVNHRVKGLAMAQSADIHDRLTGEGVRIVAGQGRLSDEIRGLAAHRVEVLDDDGRVTEELESDVVLIATGADPRVLPGAEPDGERILDWRDVYDLDGDARAPRRRRLRRHRRRVRLRLPRGRACRSRWSPRRDQVLPGEDADAAEVLEEVFQSRGGRIAERGRAASVTRTEKGVRRRADRRPHRRGLARADDRRHRAEHRRAQPRADRRRGRPQAGHIVVDRVSRTSRARHLRRRRRHRRLPARLGRRHAGPDRHVARARRGRRADQAEDRRGQRLHPPRDRHGRASRRRRSPTTRTSTSSGCRWPPTPAPR